MTQTGLGEARGDLGGSGWLRCRPLPSLLLSCADLLPVLTRLREFSAFRVLVDIGS